MRKLLPMAILMTSILLSIPTSVNAAGSQVGRYLTASNQPNPAQINLLTQRIQIRFPQNVKTIGKAMNYLLRLSGYSLVAEEQMNAALKTTISKPLPVIDRELGPLSLKDGLLTLVGPAFSIIEDPINRSVDFRLKPAFRAYVAQQQKHTQKRKLKHGNNIA